MKNPSKIIVCVLVLLLFIPAAVFAHAFLDRAEPRVGSTVDKAPKEVEIWFTQQVEPAFSAIEVFDSDGKQVDKKDTHVDSGDQTLLIVSLNDLPSGTYKVSWHVVSVDTHKTHGDFHFEIKP